MREAEFAKYLNEDPNIQSKVKAVNSRMSKARMVENHFGISIDTIVANDYLMYKILIRVKSELKDTNGNISNAIRKYYHFANGNTFPPLSQYCK